MAQYKTGLATFTNGSATVTGTGTAWLANLKAGDDFVRKGDTLTTYPAYEVGAIVSDTELTLTAPYGGDSAIDAQYVAHIDFQADGKTPKFDNGDIETASIFNKFGLLYSSIKAWVYELFVSSVDSIADLPTTGTTGQKVSVTGYYDGTTVGGGDFVWGTGRHDGGTFIDPLRAGEIGTAAYYVDSGVDVSGWARLLPELKSIKIVDFGAVEGNTSENSDAMQAAINYGANLGIPASAGAGIYRWSSTLTIPSEGGLIGAGQAELPIIGGSTPTNAFGTLFEYFGTGNGIEVRGTFSPYSPRLNIVLGGFRLLTRSSADKAFSAEFMTRFYMYDIFFDGIPDYQIEMLGCYNGKVERCFVKGGQLYNCLFSISLSDPVFSGQTLFEKCDFWEGDGHGFYLDQPAQIMAQVTFDTCHFQQNQRGFEHAGGRQPVFLDCHFENNREYDLLSSGVNSALVYGGYCNSPDTTPGRSSIIFEGRDGLVEGMGFNEQEVGNCVLFGGNNNTVRLCNFRKVDGATRTAIRIQGNGNRVEDNSFINNSSGGQDCVTIESGASRTLLGYCDFDSSVTSGRCTVNDNSTIYIDETIKESGPIDLNASSFRYTATSFGRQTYIRIAKVVYPSAFSGATPININIGKSTAPNTNSASFFSAHATPAATGSFSEEVILLSSDKSFSATDILNITTTSSQGVAGSAIVELKLLPYKLFD